MNLIALPAFDDNYIWLLEHNGRAIVVDPGDATIASEALTKHHLTLEAILITHHHLDHTAGLPELEKHYGVRIFAPKEIAMSVPLHYLGHGDEISLLGQVFVVLEVPGHTAGHIAYFLPAHANQSPLLFCGDTLFSGGCGRLFEGTPAQMLASLDQLAELPSDTRLVCAHEYTLSNLRFANTVEPDNTALQRYTLHCQTLRQNGKPTLPSTLAIERDINPFLRSRLPSVRQSIAQQFGTLATDADYFAALRESKNNFR